MGCNILHLFKTMLFDNLGNDLGNAYMIQCSLQKSEYNIMCPVLIFIELMYVVGLEGKTHLSG